MKRSYLLLSLLTMALLFASGLSSCYAMAENLNAVPPLFSTQPGLLNRVGIWEDSVKLQGQEETPAPVEGEGESDVVPPDNAAAIVNGQIITLDAYNRQLGLAQWALESQGYDLASDQGKQMFSTVRRQVLEDMINLIVIEQAAASQGITVTVQAVDDAVAKSIEEGGGRPGFEQWLQETGQTEDDYRNMIRSQFLTEAIGEKVTGKLPEKAPQASARHILLDSEEAAKDVLQQLQNGADFVALAKEHSIDQGTKDQGGTLGWFPRHMMPAEIDEAVFNSDVGLVGEVVPDAFGTFHVVEILEKDPQRELTEEQINSLKASAFMRWLAEQRLSSQIDRFMEFEE